MSLLTMCWLLYPTIFVLCFLICNITADGNIDAIAAGHNVGIENDVLHFSYELERTWLNGDKRPCQNFFEFVCGRSFNSSEAQLLVQRQRQAQQQKFEQFLQSEYDEQLMDTELKLKLFYMSCKEARSIENLKSTFMYRTSGGWPAIDDAATMIRKRRNITWLGVLSAFHEAGFEYFFNTHIEIKSNKRIVQLEPDLTMRYTLRKFEQLASDILNESNIDGSRARLVALEIMSFERNRREIAKIQQQQDVEAAAASATSLAQEFTYENFKMAFLESASQAEWDAFFKRILGKTLKPSDIVLVHQMSKLKKYFELLQTTTMSRFLNWIWIDYLMDKNTSDCQTQTRYYFENTYQNIVERINIDRVQMAQMYTDLVQGYEALLSPSVWIDEMSHQRSKQFHGRVMQLTLNGDSQLDNELADITITRRNFYRNVEKMQRYLMQQQKQKHKLQQFDSPMQSHEITKAASEFMKIFLNVGDLLRQQNLTFPLNYILVGERFAEMMIASGSSSTTPGAWRSMDSEREFEIFKECLSHQMSRGNSKQATSDNSTLNYNPNDLLLHILAQHQMLHALNLWQTKNVALWKRLDRLLSAGRVQLTLRKLYFVAELLTKCHLNSNLNSNYDEQRKFVNSYLRNSQEFTQAFGCQAGDELYARNTCKVL